MSLRRAVSAVAVRHQVLDGRGAVAWGEGKGTGTMESILRTLVRKRLAYGCALRLTGERGSALETESVNLQVQPRRCHRCHRSVPADRCRPRLQALRSVRSSSTSCASPEAWASARAAGSSSACTPALHHWALRFKVHRPGPPPTSSFLYLSQSPAPAGREIVSLKVSVADLGLDTEEEVGVGGDRIGRNGPRRQHD